MEYDRGRFFFFKLKIVFAHSATKSKIGGTFGEEKQVKKSIKKRQIKSPDLSDMLYFGVIEVVEFEKHIRFTLKYVPEHTRSIIRVQSVCRAAHLAPTPTSDLCNIAHMVAKASIAVVAGNVSIFFFWPVLFGRKFRILSYGAH